MKKLTIEESFDNYLNTLEWCSSSLLNKPDVLIERELFDDFGLEYTAFLSPYTRNRLLEYGIIDDGISMCSEKLQNLLLEMERSDIEWNARAIKESESWREVFILSDKIKSLINRKWNEDDIKSLRGL